MNRRIHMFFLTGPICTGKTNSILNAKDHYQALSNCHSSFTNDASSLDVPNSKTLSSNSSNIQCDTQRSTDSKPAIHVLNIDKTRAILFVPECTTDTATQQLFELSSQFRNLYELQITMCSAAGELLLQAVETAVSDSRLKDCDYIQIIFDRAYPDNKGFYETNLEECGGCDGLVERTLEEEDKDNVQLDAESLGDSSACTNGHGIKKNEGICKPKDEERHRMHQVTKTKKSAFDCHYKDKLSHLFPRLQKTASANGFALKISKIEAEAVYQNVSNTDPKYQKEHEHFFEVWKKRAQCNPRSPKTSEEFHEFNQQLMRNLHRNYEDFNQIMKECEQTKNAQGLTLQLKLDFETRPDKDQPLVILLDSMWENRICKSDAVIVLGFPGIGKGTLCKQLEKDPGYVHISVGELLRAKGENCSNGEFVKSEISGGLLKEEILKQRGNGPHTFLIDGFPANKENLEYWNRHLRDVVSLKHAIILESTNQINIQRCLKRGRQDDKLEIIQKRMALYTSETLPVFEHFKKNELTRQIDAMKSIKEVYIAVRKILETNHDE